MPAPPPARDLARDVFAKHGEGGPLQIVPGRLGLPPPGVIGRFDLAQYLPPHVRAGFLDPSCLHVKAGSSQPGILVPKVRVHCADPLELFRLLDGSDMIAFVRDVDVPRRLFDVRGCVALAAGAFAVPKSEDEDRLITDRRPGNAIESAVGAVG